MVNTRRSYKAYKNVPIFGPPCVYDATFKIPDNTGKSCGNNYWLIYAY